MVRATFAGFSTALSAIQASQKRLDITGQNLANMNTTGYTRQQLQVSSLNYTNPVSHYPNGSEIVVGFGVHMDKVTQVRDPYLDMQYRSQMYKSGYTDAMQTSLDRLAEFLDESHIDGIRSAFDDIAASLESMSDPPKVNNPIYESELRSRMQALTNLFNESSRKLDEAEQAEISRLTGKGTSENGAVEQVNDILRQIGDLNRQIKRNQIVGQQSLELMDERNVLLDELSSYIPIEVTYFKDVNHDGVANRGRIDINKSLDQGALGIDITKYDKGLIINGEEITDIDANTSISDIMTKINNNTKAGVKATYDNETGQIMLESTGTGKTVSLDSPLAKDLFGTKADLSEEYYLDQNGNILGKREWPDDLRVEMIYEEDGVKKRITLVEGSVGNGEMGKENYGQLTIIPDKNDAGAFEPKDVVLTFTAAPLDRSGQLKPVNDTVVFSRNTAMGDDNNTQIPKIQFPSDSGSIQSSLDMLWKDGSTKNLDDVKGYEYYRNQLDTLARSFAIVMNEINIEGTSTSATKDRSQFLLSDRDSKNYNDNGASITAGNIGISDGWVNGTVHVSKSGDNSNDVVLNLLQAMSTKYGIDANGNANASSTIQGISFSDPVTGTDINLNNNSFADYMNHISTILANDSHSNQNALKTNVTVLNGIQNSRDSVSGVSLNEEAANTMIYMSAYNAASRLMTALDEALNTLINGTGMVGR